MITTNILLLTVGVTVGLLLLAYICAELSHRIHERNVQAHKE